MYYKNATHKYMKKVIITPSQASIKNESFSVRTVSVVYGLPITNSFIELSPNERVTAKTPVHINKKKFSK